MAEENESGISLGDIFRSIKRWIWLVLGIVVAVTLVVSLVFGLFINPRSVEYSMSFHLLYPTSASARYPDGSPFYDSDILSYGFLNEAKASDEDFQNIDLTRMLRNGDIALQKTQNERENALYTVTVKAQYFKNGDMAEKFIRAVAQVPVSRILANAESVNYKLDGAIFQGASFDEKIGLLSTLKSTLLNACDAWISMYGATYPVGQRSLSDYRSEIYVVYGDSTQKAFEAESDLNGYGGLDLSAETIEKAMEERCKALEQEKALNQQIIAALEAQTQPQARSAARSSTNDSTTVVIQEPNMDSAEMLAYYKQRNAQIDYQIGTSLDWTSQTAVNNVKNYERRLVEQFTKLQAAADTVAGVASSVYEKNTAVSFRTQAVEGDGAVSLALVIVATVVVSFIIAAVIACALDARKNKKPRKEQPAPEDGEGESKE